ncbi:putative NADP-dependent alcohol dehydrogenase [Leishmania major strain Friedlin]|uniref:Putative NADP-dependent alcohol dehydrogenase n=1 Tax=Leishmania major TaxID=5664 RepID=Q4QBD8_LEIMA|nr:putative NADP-dependent alcohol dehydrogenase [Leishmania major strain Friedlin]CAG9574146.1 NADP-dependent_alcohol_dehydrogenase_-_putative [Leishmania major strain Friedlin]CAJ04055.1 putative NADP-dependent alcohol dehydrogenase [Leishmania major strain Friedlin]|eukprot:XP_001683360.1 putative NADP-dependent alcohol dehydrogenase [Leishmania major strain Friedlin]
MPTEAHGWAALSAKSKLEPFAFQRRDVGPDDVVIAIAYCGVCHSDVHQARDEWDGSTFPMVPGHEIVGHVTKVGSEVTKYKAGDRVGVGCMVDSCMKCRQCERGLEQYCVNGASFTYNSTQQDKKTPTFGGYSDHVVVREHFVVSIPDNLDLCAAAPLLCAGVTTFSPLRYWGVKKGTRVGVVGLGGLGHMAVKLANAMGAEVTVFTRSSNKVEEAENLGAHHVVNTNNEQEMNSIQGTLDVIVDTVGMSHDLRPYMMTLDIDGKLALVGMPEHAHPPLDPRRIIASRQCVGGSNIAGMPETQELLNFCGEHNITATVEKIGIEYINEAYERILASDVRYRFVIDMASLKKE